MRYIYYYDTMIGKIGIVEKDGAITNVILKKERIPDGYLEEETFVIKEAYRQIDEYLHKKRKEFQLPIMLEGTDFQIRDWREISKIPYGKTKTYGEIAESLGLKKGARAVGNANNKNPLPIIIPCHRVIGASGSLVGYGGGLNIKRTLLDIEGSHYNLD